VTDLQRHTDVIGPQTQSHSAQTIQQHLSSAEDILAATAHELRLPLSHIKGFVTSLRRTDVTWDEETRREFIAEIDVETDRLAELIDSLLSARASQVSSAPTVDLAFTSPVSVIQRACQRIQHELAGRPLRLDLVPNLPSVRMNASQMERVLANLLQNAVKYSPPDTTIGISARITADDELEFSVDDEGPGISPEDRQRIFTPFFRKHTADYSHVPGHGLGLAICHSIVLAHRGRIRVSDRPGSGTRFSVLIPARVEALPTLLSARRGAHPDSNDTGKDVDSDPAMHSRRGRRSANAQVAFEQPSGQRVRRAPRSRWHGGNEASRRAHVRSAAA
jgi:two-component system, OmpR family, sensor histidine kinase KdpD